ncbi:MAG: DNA-binding protein [Lachnospiraceae bacterium]|nr:DNA-binding protein [Lachnospiraceae bacterium]
MKYFIAEEIGRTFILRMERGDFLKEKITRLCREEKINEAVISSGIATFDIVNIQMSNTAGFPMGYNVLNLQEPLELASLDGTIINAEAHIHGVIGNGNRTWAGHLLEGCRILYLGEIVIQELLGESLIRKADKDHVFLIDKK